MFPSRLQRHFATFAVSFPGQDSLYAIYNSILSDHLGHISIEYYQTLVLQSVFKYYRVTHHDS